MANKDNNHDDFFIIEEKTAKFSEDEPYKEKENVSDYDLFKFARGILMVVALIYTIAMLIELFLPGTNVFDSCKVTLPPIATSVIGYYFGASKSG